MSLVTPQLDKRVVICHPVMVLWKMCASHIPHHQICTLTILLAGSKECKEGAAIQSNNNYYPPKYKSEAYLRQNSPTLHKH